MSALSQGAFDITVGALQGRRFRQNDPHLPSTADIRAQLPLVNYREWCADRRGGGRCLNAGPGVEALIVERDGRVWASPGLATRYRYIQIVP